MIELREEDKATVINNHRLVEEVFVEMRKACAQNYYVIEVLAGEEWDDDRLEFYPVPDHLLGFWRMAGADDLSYRGVTDAIKFFDWVRCHKVTIATHDWEALEDKALGPLMAIAGALGLLEDGFGPPGYVESVPDNTGRYAKEAIDFIESTSGVENLLGPDSRTAPDWFVWLAALSSKDPQ